MRNEQARFPRSRRLDIEARQPSQSRADGNPPRRETPAERAARLETRALELRLRELEARQRTARLAIEEELRRQHWGHMPEGWHGHDEG